MAYGLGGVPEQSAGRRRKTEDVFAEVSGFSRGGGRAVLAGQAGGTRRKSRARAEFLREGADAVPADVLRHGRGGPASQVGAGRREPGGVSGKDSAASAAAGV